MRKLLAGASALSLLLLSAPAFAGNAQQVGGVGLTGTTCTNGAVNVGNNQPVALNSLGQLCVAGSFSSTPSGTQDVNLKQVGGVTTLVGAGASGTGAQRVTVSQDTTTVAGSGETAGSAVTGVGVRIMGSDGTNARDIQVSTAGTTLVQGVQGGGAILTTSFVGTTGGWSESLQGALTNTAVSVKGTGGTLGGYDCYNPNATAAYIQIFNVASGSVTLGTTVPVAVVALGATSGRSFWADTGPAFATAISVAATTTYNGSTALVTPLTCTFYFK